jgi:hypothetical protein
MRHTRNATAFIAWVIGVIAVLGLVGTILTGIELANIKSALSSQTTSTSQCQSQGGTDPTC